MSRSALALIDTDSRNRVFQFIKQTMDRKVQKNEMISPYDDQLIGKMNFSMGTEEKSMFFTYARASEYPGIRLKHHKIVYASMDVNDRSTAAFTQICSQFGGYVIPDDEVSEEWVKIEANPTVEEEYEKYEEFYLSRESFSVSKEDLQRNRGKSDQQKTEDMVEKQDNNSGAKNSNADNRENKDIRKEKTETEKEEKNEKGKDGEQNRRSRNYHRNRNRNNHSNGEGKQNNQPTPKQDDKQGKQEKSQGNQKQGENGNGNSYHRRRRRPHNNRPKGEGNQAPKTEA